MTPPPAQARLWARRRRRPGATRPWPRRRRRRARSPVPITPWTRRGCRHSPAWAARTRSPSTRSTTRAAGSRRRAMKGRGPLAVATLNLEADAAKSAGHSNGRRDGSKPAGEDVNAAFAAFGPGPHAPPDVLCLQEMQRCSRHNCPSCALWKLPPRPRLQDSLVSPPRGLRRRLQARRAALDGRPLRAVANLHAREQGAHRALCLG